MKDDVVNDIKMWDEWNVTMATWKDDEKNEITVSGIITIIHMDGGLWNITCYKSTYT